MVMISYIMAIIQPNNLPCFILDRMILRILDIAMGSDLSGWFVPEDSGLLML